ncbi:hypothetical protein ILYODFUR_018526 [Ilyodon furcidens]|uniref:Uncharacterized protein n=1 Tax=Ilyodon furcidens TaxID=33524 RepID=A0ABV0TNR2_9TELE
MTALGKAIRNQYPPTAPVAVPEFDWDQHPKEHINAAVDTWMRHTGVNPKCEGTGIGQLFREAILKGVHVEVQWPRSWSRMSCWWSAWSWWMAWSAQRKGWSQRSTGRCVLQLQSVLPYVDVPMGKALNLAGMAPTPPLQGQYPQMGGHPSYSPY